MGHKPNQQARKKRREREARKAVTPAQKSARKADAVRKAKERRDRAAADAREREQRARQAVVTRDAKKKAPEIYRQYRKEIAKAEKGGAKTLTTDETSWSGDYYGPEPEVSPEDRHASAVLEEARRIARKMLEKDGYKVEADGADGDSSWGSGSDALPVSGWSRSWIVISW